MNVEAYDPLVRQLCESIPDYHVRSVAEQEARIALWRNGDAIDGSAFPPSLANRYIARARENALRGREWTGLGKNHKRCGHGDQKRDKRGRCLICKAARQRGYAAEKKRKEAA